MKTLILSLVSLLLQGTAAAKPAQGSHEYIVGVRDVLQVVVHGHEMLSLPRVVVDSDGTIDFPELGRVAIAGKSPRQIEEDLKKRLLDRQIMTKVSMTVTVTEHRSQTIHVFGDGIKMPGTYPVRGDATLLSAIGDAGGFNSQAGAWVFIARKPTGATDVNNPARFEDVKERDMIKVGKADLEMGRAPRIYLHDGDTIFVPKAEVFFIDGQVRSPGEYVLRPELTVGKAITIAGGYTDRAAKNRIEIERTVNGRIVKIKVKEADLVKAGDRIRVPTRWI